MADVFISYSRKDKEFVRQLFNALEAHGRDTWVDWDDIPPSGDWMQEIHQGIESADFFIFVITPDSVNSKVCYTELEHAHTHNKRLVPLLRREVRMSSKRAAGHAESQNPLDRAYSALGVNVESDQIMARLSPHNWIFFRDEDNFDDGVKTLLDTFATDLEFTREHTRLLVRAREWDTKDRDESFLLTGSAVDEAEAWLAEGANKNPKPTDLHRAYINASRLHQLQEEQHQFRLEQQATNRLRYLAVVFAFFSVAAAALSLFAFTQRRDAENARATSDFSLQSAVEARETAQRRADEAESFVLAERTRLLLDNGLPVLALALALEANNTENPIPAAQAILSEAAYSAPRRAFDVPGGGWASVSLLHENTFVAGHFTGIVAAWDLETGRLLWSAEDEHQFEVNTLSVSPDGSQLLSASVDGLVVLRDLETGGAIQQFTIANGSLYAAGFTDDGDSIIAAVCRSEDEGQRSCSFGMTVWDAVSGEQLKHNVYDDILTDKVAFSADGKLAVVSTQDTSEIVMLDTETGDEIRRLPVFSPVMTFEFNDDGTVFVSAHADNTISFWEIETGLEINTIFGFGATPTSLDIHEGDTAILIGHSDGIVVEVDLETYFETIYLRGHSDRITDVVYIPDDNLIITVSEDGNTLLWDWRPGAVVGRIGQDFANPITQAVLVSATAVGISAEVEVVKWDIPSQEERSRTALPVPSGSDVVISPDGRHLLLRVGSGEAMMWDVENEREMYTIEGDSFVMRQSAFSPDGAYLLVRMSPRDTRLIQVDTGEVIHTYDLGNELVVEIAFNPNGESFVTGQINNVVVVWDMETGDQIREFNTHNQTPYLIVISPNGTDALISEGDSLITMWNLDAGEVRARFDGHGGDVTAITFTPDGSNAISSSLDQELIVWDLESSTPIRILAGHNDGVLGVSVSNDGNAFLSYSAEDGIIIWRNDSLEDLIRWTCQNRAVRPLTEAEKITYNITSDTDICAPYRGGQRPDAPPPDSTPPANPPQGGNAPPGAPPGSPPDGAPPGSPPPQN